MTVCVWRRRLFRTTRRSHEETLCIALVVADPSRHPVERPGVRLWKRSAPDSLSTAPCAARLTVRPNLLVRLSSGVGRRCLGPPLPREPLRFMDRLGRHLRGDGVAVRLRPIAELYAKSRNRQIQPHMRRYVVLGDALALVVHEAELVLRSGVALFSGQAEPLCSFGMVLGNALADGVHDAELVLRVDVLLFSGRAPPLDRFGNVLADALAVGVHEAELVLRFGVALFSGQAVPLCSFGMVLGDALAAVVRETETELRVGAALFSG